MENRCAELRIGRGYVLSLKEIYYDIKEIIFETKEHEKVDENKFYKRHLGIPWKKRISRKSGSSNK